MSKQLRIFTLVVMFVCLFSGTAHALEDVYWNSASLKDVLVKDNGVSTTYMTKAITITDFLVENNITINANDKVNFKPEDALYEHGPTELDIVRAINVTITIGSEVQKLNLPPGILVGNVIGKLPKEPGIEYSYDGKLTEQLADGQNITVKKSKTDVNIDTAKVEIPFNTETVQSDELDKGTDQVTQEGVLGLKEVTTKITLVNGTETARDVSEEIKQKPVNKIIKIGTKEKSKERELGVRDDDAPEKYTAQYTMEATAYTSDYASTGKNPGDPGFGVTATGTKARRGIVAVDPNVIPLGSKLFIKGYGYAIAADTGGGINGNAIDLYFDSSNECYRFGRRDVKVFVLAD